MVQPSGWKGVWHRESKVDWIVTLAGKWFVEAMEGTRVDRSRRRLARRGSEHTIADAEGRKGHRSGNIGDETVTPMVIETDATPTVDQPCRFK